MTADFLETQLVAYLSLREALGFHIRAEKILLPEFVAFVKAQEIPGPIRAQMTLEWACQASAHRHRHEAKTVTPAIAKQDRSLPVVLRWVA